MLVSVPMLSIRPPMVEPSLAMVMNSSPGWPSSKQADGQVTFVAGDVEFVRDSRAGVGQAAAQAAGRLRPRSLAISASSSLMRASSAASAASFVAAFVGLFGVERLRTLGAVAINGHAFEAHLPGLHVGVA